MFWSKFTRLGNMSLPSKLSEHRCAGTGGRGEVEQKAGKARGRDRESTVGMKKISRSPAVSTHSCGVL